MNRQELQSLFQSTLVIYGKDKTVAEAISSKLAKSAAALFWRSNAWSFSTKVGSLTLTEGEPYFTLAADFGKLLAIRRTTTDDYGHKLIGLSPSEFDRRFPSPASASESAVLFYKIIDDDETKKLYTYPISDANDSASYLYKVAFKETYAFDRIPDVYLATLLECMLYLISPPEQRMYTMQSWKRALLEAKRDDALHEDIPPTRSAGDDVRNVWARDSWQFQLSGGDPYAEW